jgi:hypothetical protein
MKWLQILRAILNLLYFFSWITAISAPFIAWLVITGTVDYSSNINTGIAANKIALVIIMSLVVIGYFFFLAMIHHLRKAAYLITPSQLISDTLQHHFYRAGLFCVIGSLLAKLPSVAYIYVISPLFIKSVATTRAGLELGYGFDSIFAVLTFGIFLIVFSKIIKTSLDLQQEQALTV